MLIKSRRILYILMVLVLIVTGCNQKTENSDQKIWDSIDRKLQKNNIETITILSAQINKKEDMQYKTYLEGKILALSGDYLVLERSKELINEILENMKYEESDLFDSNLGDKYGQFIKSQAVVVAKQNILKIIEVKRSLVIYSGEISIPQFETSNVKESLSNFIESFLNKTPKGNLPFSLILFIVVIVAAITDYKIHNTEMLEILPAGFISALVTPLMYLLGIFIGQWVGHGFAIFICGLLFPALASVGFSALFLEDPEASVLLWLPIIAIVAAPVIYTLSKFFDLLF